MHPVKNKITPKRLKDALGTFSTKHSVTEVHVHLGGSVPLYRLWEMGIARGIRMGAGSYEEFIQTLTRRPDNTGDLDRYLEIFEIVELIQAGPEAVAESIRIAINGAYRTGGMKTLGPGGEGADPEPAFAIKQLEIRFNPMKRSAVYVARDREAGIFDVDRIIKAACESAEESELAYRGNMRVGLIFCFGRDLAFEVNRRLADKVKAWKKSQRKIIGIDLAGPESVNSLSDPKELDRFAELYADCGADLGRTIHLGETPHTTIETFINVIKALKPQRVSHPISAIKAFWDKQDARGLELLAQEKIICELCIYSNVLTKAIGSAAEYGKLLNTLDRFNIPYCFSTDSPALQMSTLASEIEYLLADNAITPEQIYNALLTAEKCTFIK